MLRNNRVNHLSKVIGAFVCLLILAACKTTHSDQLMNQNLSETEEKAQVDQHELSEIAESYVRLGLELGQYDKDYVDAYLGPAEWQEQASTNTRSKENLASDIAALYAQLQSISVSGPDMAVRHKALLRNVRATHD